MTSARERKKIHLIKDLVIIVFSIILAVALVKSNLILKLFDASDSTAVIGSLIAGSFFTSVFTTAPAMVALGELSLNHSILLISFCGGLGALVGDMIIYRFVKDSVSEDINYLITITHSRRFFSIFKLKVFRWLIPFLGALIIASPLPDELGLTILGLSKMKMQSFIPLTFFFNFLGILIISIIARELT